MRLGADDEALDRLASHHDVCAAHLARVRIRLRAADRRWWTGPAARRWWSTLDEVVVRGLVVAGAAVADAARELRRHARQQREASLAPAPSAVQLLDVRGDGRFVGRVGPARADVVVVLVPGVSTDLGDRAGLTADAYRVWRSVVSHAGTAELMGPVAPERVAVVPWLGYDPPDHLVGALDPRPAAAGAAALAAQVAQLRRAGASRIVLVGHSYGALVATGAAAVGAAPDEIVLLGAPGLGVADPSDWIDGVGLWSATAAGDPIDLVARTGLVHGPDPTSFAAHLPTSARGHGSYLRDQVLLDALSSVALGLPPAVGG